MFVREGRGRSGRGEGIGGRTGLGVLISPEGAGGCRPGLCGSKGARHPSARPRFMSAPCGIHERGRGALSRRLEELCQGSGLERARVDRKITGEREVEVEQHHERETDDQCDGACSDRVRRDLGTGLLPAGCLGRLRPMGAVERLRAERVIGVLRRVPDVERVAEELVAAGIGVLEVTLDDADAPAVIERLCARGDVSVLAGTVRSVEQAEVAVAAGAEGLVSPVFSEAVLARGLQLGVPVIPGALTPTEIEAAWRAGATMVKLFPARAVGPQYVADVLKPLADVRLVCTGGVTTDNAMDYLAAGAAAVGVSFRDARTVAKTASRLVAAVAAQ